MGMRVRGVGRFGTCFMILGLSLGLTLPMGCAAQAALAPQATPSGLSQTAQAPKPVAAAETAAPDPSASAQGEDGADATPVLSSPSEIPERFGTACPVPPFRLAAPTERTLRGERFVVEGSTLRRAAGEAPTPLRIGVLGATKDVSDATQQNLRAAARAFRQAGVQLIVVNGDLGEDTELDESFRLLGETFAEPVLVFSGNMEWTSAFTEAFTQAARAFPQLINGNWTRDLDLGGVHVVTLPGWFNHRFVTSGACRYRERDIEQLRALVAPMIARGERVILVAHGPPAGEGAQSLDVTHDAGNVGNPALTGLIEALPLRYGIFSHILEAGGRAVRGFGDDDAVSLPMDKTVPALFVNAGSASGFPWAMLDGRTSHGMAMIFTLDDQGARAEVIRLRGSSR